MDTSNVGETFGSKGSWQLPMDQTERLPAVCRLLREHAEARGLSNAEIARRIEQNLGIVRSRAAVSQVMNGGVPSRKSPVLGLASRPRNQPPLAFLIASVLDVPIDELHRAIGEDVVDTGALAGGAADEQKRLVRLADGIASDGEQATIRARLHQVGAMLEDIERSLASMTNTSPEAHQARRRLSDARRALSDVRNALIRIGSDH